MSQLKLSPFQEAINKLIPDSLKNAIKDLHVKFSADPAAPPIPAPAPVALEKILKTKDGKTLSAAGEPAVDVMIMDTTSGTPVPLDGSVELEDGSKITAVSGKITVYEPAPVVPPMDMAAATAQLKADFAAEKVAFEKSFTAKFTAHQKELDEQKATIKDLTAINKTVVEFMHKVLETPVPEKKPETLEVKFEKKLTDDEYKKLSNADKVTYNRIWK